MQIPVQDILDHTVQRLAYVQQDVLLIHHDHTKNSPIKVIYKWGLDGSDGHSIYKLCFADNSLYGDSRQEHYLMYHSPLTNVRGHN